MINPLAGRELEFDEQPAKEKKNILVVGAGITGLAAARILAKCGHHVVAAENEATAGGQLNLACRAPFKQEISKWIVYLREECSRYGAEIRYATPADAEYIRAEHPDIVILATGAEPFVLPVEGKEELILPMMY